jgi:hypothetical protein
MTPKITKKSPGGWIPEIYLLIILLVMGGSQNFICYSFYCLWVDPRTLSVTYSTAGVVYVGICTKGTLLNYICTAVYILFCRLGLEAKKEENLSDWYSQVSQGLVLTVF